MTGIVNLTSHYIGSPTPGVNLYQLPNASMQVLEDIINATWNAGLTNKADFSAKIAAVLSGFLDITAAPHVTAGSVTVPTVVDPNVSIPTNITVANIDADWIARYQGFATDLDGMLSTFKSTYFPSESAAYNAAETWLLNAVQDPSGLPVAVRTAILADAQSTILADKVRAQDAVVAQFAARGFPLPPDAAASAVLQIEQKAQDSVAGTARQIMLAAVAQLNTVVAQLYKAREIAMGDTLEYIKAMLGTGNTSAQLAGIGIDAQSKLISSAASYLNARSEAAKVVSQVAQYNNSTALEAAVKNQMSDLTLIEDKLKALLAEAQAIAQMTTALFNNIHVGANLTANGGTTVSQSNEF